MLWNEQERKKLEREAPLQQAKHVKLYSDVLKAYKRERAGEREGREREGRKREAERERGREREKRGRERKREREREERQREQERLF